MPRWTKWITSLSRRSRSLRSRVLRFDELENRRLLRSTILGDALELSLLVEELEAEHARWVGEAIVMTSTVTTARAYVSQSGYAEGEDDGWEYEQDNEDGIAIGAGNTFWIGRVIVLSTGREGDEVASTKKDLPASSIPSATNGTEKAVRPSHTAQDAFEKGESEAPQTVLEGDRLTSEGTGDGQRVASPSPAQSGLATLVAATANQKETGPDAVRAEALSTNSVSGFALPQRGDEKFATGDPSRESPATTRTRTTEVGNALEIPGFGRTGSRPDSSATAERRHREITRSTESPTRARHTAHDQVFASSVDESRSATRWPLRAALSPDFAALERTLEHLLANRGEIGSDVADWFTRADVSHWTLTATIALIAAEIVRRRAQRSRSNESDPATNGADVSLRLFPELLGVPIGVRP